MDFGNSNNLCEPKLTSDNIKMIIAAYMRNKNKVISNHSVGLPLFRSADVLEKIRGSLVKFL